MAYIASLRVPPFVDKPIQHHSTMAYAPRASRFDRPNALHIETSSSCIPYARIEYGVLEGKKVMCSIVPRIPRHFVGEQGAGCIIYIHDLEKKGGVPLRHHDHHSQMVFEPRGS